MRRSNAHVEGWNFIFRGTAHQNFCDTFHLADKSLARYMSLGTDIDPYEVGKALDEIILAYFLSIVYSSSVDHLLSSSSSNKHLPIESPGMHDSEKFLSHLEFAVRQISDCAFEFDPSVLSILRKHLVGVANVPSCYDVSVFQLVNHPNYWSKLVEK